jgi:hypothetical protein
MPITDSRNKGGTLTLDALAFAKQATSVTLTPSADEDGDDLETLDGSTILADEVTSWALDLGMVQDFEDPAGFVEFARANAGDVVPFDWAPNGATGPSYSGNVKVRAVPIGGDVASRLTTTASWPVEGQPSVDYPTP